MINHTEIVRLDNLNPLEVYTCILNLVDLRNRYIKIIDIEGDKQKRSTGIKADMTDWRLEDHYEEFSPLVEVFWKIYKHITLTYRPQFYEILSHYLIDDFDYKQYINLWGARYKSREKAESHNHYPSNMSFCLYLKTPKGCPGLSFTEISKTVHVEENQLIIFNGSVNHSVKSKKFRGKRYILAANINMSVDCFYGTNGTGKNIKFVNFNID